MTADELIAEYGRLIWRVANAFAPACRAVVILDVDDLYSIGVAEMVRVARRGLPPVSSAGNYYAGAAGNKMRRAVLLASWRKFDRTTGLRRMVPMPEADDGWSWEAGASDPGFQAVDDRLDVEAVVRLASPAHQKYLRALLAHGTQAGAGASLGVTRQAVRQAVALAAAGVRELLAARGAA